MKMRGRLDSGCDFEDADLRVADGVRVVVDVDALHVCFALLEIEMFDVVLLAAMNVDGFFVQKTKCAWKIHFADNRRRAGDIDDEEIIAGDGPQTDGISGISLLRPVIILPGQVKKTDFGKPRAQIRKIDLSEFVVRTNGQFERRTFQMVDQNFQIVRLDESMFGRVAKKIIRMAHDELIERRRRSHQHGAGASAAAAGAAGALPGGGDGAGISGKADGAAGADADTRSGAVG